VVNHPGESKRASNNPAPLIQAVRHGDRLQLREMLNLRAPGNTIGLNLINRPVNPVGELIEHLTPILAGAALSLFPVDLSSDLLAGLVADVLQVLLNVGGVVEELRVVGGVVHSIRDRLAGSGLNMPGEDGL